MSSNSSAAEVELARRAIGLIDLTDLADDHSGDQIAELCSRAKAHHTAAVCVWPEHVAQCAILLQGSDVRVATVVNFPTGTEPPDDVLAATRRALADGADDIDVVIPYSALMDGDRGAVSRLVSDVAALIPGHVGLKTILETGTLETPELIAAAAQIAVDSGADFIKTSTGKAGSGASPEAVRVMLEVIAQARDAGKVVGLKPSGGIRDYSDAASYLAQADEAMGSDWATPATFRFGASGLLDALIAIVESSDYSGDSEQY